MTECGEVIIRISAIKMERLNLILAICAVYLSPALAISCTLPYEDIGGKCLYIDSNEQGSWFDMRLFCSREGYGGDLAIIDSPNLHRAIIDYIEKYGLDRSNYWIGASDDDLETHFKWLDGTNVPKGAPFWRYDCDISFTQRPLDDPTANCAALDQESHFLLADFSCLGDAGSVPFSPICEAKP